MSREIKIKPVLNGFVCSVGCQTVVFNSPRDLGSAIVRYFTDPEATEKEFIEKAVNKMEGPCPPPPERNEQLGTSQPEERRVPRTFGQAIGEATTERRL